MRAWVNYLKIKYNLLIYEGLEHAHYIKILIDAGVQCGVVAQNNMCRLLDGENGISKILTNIPNCCDMEFPQISNIEWKFEFITNLEAIDMLQKEIILYMVGDDTACEPIQNHAVVAIGINYDGTIKFLNSEWKDGIIRYNDNGIFFGLLYPINIGGYIFNKDDILREFNYHYFC